MNKTDVKQSVTLILMSLIVGLIGSFVSDFFILGNAAGLYVGGIVVFFVAYFERCDCDE